ncbi:DUF3549 family protein [Saccharobesus litoralis]|uniref:DUF3549 family protein n=1 Tax=Saccharobesus litoralis TaxID=2172099 RepID=UPI00131EE0A5|nr:DUF3549 family protein [Saccharobesus litoralis]
MQQNIQTLYQLLDVAGCDYAVYDTGRLVTKISNNDFIAFEDGLKPYPTPIQQMAKFALVYWPKQSKHNPYIWFLNLPIDEESLINSGARNHFVSIITEALGSTFAAEDSAQQKIPDNPYIKPPEEKKLAILNAKVKQDLGQPASPEYLKCAAYFENYQAGTQQASSWQQLSTQGMADFVTDLTLPNNQNSFDNVYFDLPLALQTELASLLEHAVISRALANRLIRSVRQQQFTLDQSLTNSLRILASHANSQNFRELLIDLLATESGKSTDVLTVLVARNWSALQQDICLVAFLEHIAVNTSPSVFNALFADLVAIPSLRKPIFQLLAEELMLPETRKALRNMVSSQQRV